MDPSLRIEHALEAAVARTGEGTSPPRLISALRYAVFPGGQRIRPRLSLAVALACGDRRPALADAAAASVELMHCASLVHDDLPCFDDAPLRRGKPTVHRQFGESTAVLVGDALIVLAFETLALSGATTPTALAGLVRIVGAAVGAPAGLVAGQAWESEPVVALRDYHRAKTGSLFAAATAAGALAAGADPDAWRSLGERLGEAYQVADDIRDVAAESADVGKPCGRDAALGRPNATRELGLSGALARLEQLLGTAVDAIPPCSGRDELRALILWQTRRFLPENLALRAA